MKNKLIALALLILSVSSMTFAQATIVRTATAYSTIQAAITASIAGDYISVAAGTYNEDVAVNKTVTIVGAGASSTFIVGTTGNTTPLTFNSTNATVNGFTVTHSYTPAELSAWSFNNNGVHFTGGSGNTLTNCIVTLNRNGIYFNAAQSNNIVTSNIITNNRTGINMTGKLDGTQITGNTISDNWTVGIVSYANANNTNYSNVVISGNVFSGNWYSEILIKETYSPFPSGPLVNTNTGALDVTANSFNDSPVTFSTASTVTYTSLNEPGFVSQKPTCLGGTATKPTTDLPTLRVSSSTVTLVYNNPKTLLVEAGQSIQAVIALANAGDNILVKSGLYNENITVSKALTLKSESGPSLTSITGTAGSPAVTISANNVTIDGFFISNPSGKWGISAVDRSGITIKNNVLGYIGQTDATTSGSNYGIAVVSSSAVVEQIIIRDNMISNVYGGNFKSAQGIVIGWSSGANDITNLLIRNNRINDVYSSTSAYSSGGRGAYGIQLNHANATGRTVAAQILNNTINAIEGCWAHAIGLEGNTPNALVQGNSISTIIDHKSPTDPDAVAVMVEDNASANTVTIQYNKFESVWLGVRNATSAIVNASNNYWGDLDPSDNVLNTSTGGVDYTPVLITNVDADLAAEGFQPTLSTLSVLFNSSQSGSVGRIQEGVNSARSYGTLNVSAGSYGEEVTVDKPLYIVGTGSPSTTKFIYAASPITITGFSVPSAEVVDVKPGANLNEVMDLVSPGGTVNVDPGTYPAFVVDKPITLDGNGTVFVQHGSPGITVNSTGVTITGFTFAYAATVSDYGVDVLAGAFDVTITDCNFQTTPAPGYGVINRGTGIVDARNNYWNSADGPTSTLNPGGTGNRATNASTGTLLISPWWTDAGHTNAMTPISLVAPVNTLTGVSIQPIFSWAALPGTPTSVAIEIATNSSFTGSTSVTIPVPTATSYTLTEAQKLLNNTLYYWRLVVNISGGTLYSSAYRFTTTPALTLLPINPLNGSTLVDFNNVLFSFSSGTASSSIEYVLQCIVDPTHTPVAADWVTPAKEAVISDIYSLPYQFSTAFLANTKYYWRVVVKSVPPVPGVHEVLCYSSLYRFTTKPGSYKPYLSYPIGGVPVYTNSPTLYWYIGTYDFTGLTFTIDINPGAHHYTVAPTDIMFTVPDGDLTAGTTYTWTVTCTYGTDSQTSSAGTFKTPANATSTAVRPYISYPTGGVSVYTTTPSLYWYLTGAGDGLYYNLYMKDITGGSAAAVPANWASLPGTFTLIDDDITDLSLNLSTVSTITLLPNHTYQWFVVSKNSGGVPTSSVISTSTTFKVDASLGTGNPIASWPVGNATMTTGTPTLYWYLYGLVGSIDHYVIKATNSAVPSGLTWWNANGTTLSSSVENSATSFDWSGLALSSGDVVYWAVAGANSSGTVITTWSQGSFRISSTLNAISVYCSTPTRGATIYSQSPVLYWYATGDIASIHHYKLTYSRASDLSVTGTDSYGAIRTITDNITDNFIALSGLVPGATYFWKIDACNSGGTVLATTATIGRFIVAPSSSAAVVPIAGSPINSVQLQSTAATFSWFPPVPGKTQLKYDLEYSDNSAFTNAKVVKDITDQSYTVNGLTPTKTYYWRVSSKADGGITSSYSTPAEFKISSKVTSVENETIPAEYALEQNYPNPFNPTTIINYSLPVNSFVTLKVYDMLGREVKTLVNKEVMAGRNSVEWNGDDNFGIKVATGVYVYRINASNFVSTKKMLLIK